MSQEELKPGNNTQEEGQRRTDAGDVIGVLCIVWCVFGAVWQFVDYGLLGGAQTIVDTFEVGGFYVWIGALANVGIWVTGAWFCWVIKNTYTWTPGARVIASLASACAARLLVWLLAQLFGMCVVEGGLWWGAFLLVCFLPCGFGWECLKGFLEGD